MSPLFLILPFALASPPAEAPCPPGGAPPHEVLLESLDELGVDAETQALMEVLVAEHREEVQALGGPGELDPEERRAGGRALMEELMSMLDPDQREAARELLPPPPTIGTAVR